MTKKFYVTTTIPYVNAPPHIGHALEFVQADVLARWNRLLGNDVFFLTGTDEHGTKNYTTAKKEGLHPQKFVDKNAEFFKKLIKVLNISNNYFIRTTDKKNHWPGVLEMWKRLVKKGDIYMKKYTGHYCSGCERFVTEKDLINGKCPNHPTRKIDIVSDENYFFRLSKYSDKIKKIINSKELEIYPKKWKNDFLSLIEEGLTDVSFSRSKKQLPWGVPVPNDDSQVMYVWCDALTNYLTGIGFPDKKYKKYWPADIHVVGKDMLRFHAGIWPGMLLAAGIDLPKKIIVHGFLTIDGRKMSKSTGNVIDPIEISKKYGADSVRYFFCRNFVFGEDGDFSEKALIDRHNNELANKLGNLVSRVASLIEKYGVKKLKDQNFENTMGIKICKNKVEKYMANYEFDKALNEIFNRIDKLNEYVQNKKPWENNDRKDRLEINQGVLYNLSQSMKFVTILLWPFIPETSKKIAKQFGFKVGANTLKEIEKPISDKTKIKKGKILFKKIGLVDGLKKGLKSSGLKKGLKKGL